MGLLLSILVACVGVVEIVAFYAKITRTLTSQSTQTTNFEQLSDFYIEELKKHKANIEENLKNIDRESLKEEESKRLRRSAKRYFLTEDISQSVEDIDEQKRITVTEHHFRSRSPSPIPRRLGDQDSIFQRSPSPYPCLILPVSKTISDNPTCLLGVDEELSRSPSPDHRCILDLATISDNAPNAKGLDLDSLDGVKKKKLCRTSSLRQSRKKKKNQEDESLSSSSSSSKQNNETQTAKTLTEAANALANYNREDFDGSKPSCSKSPEPFWVNG